MVDALGPEGDEGRGVPAISVGEVASNLWSGDVRMGKPRRAKHGEPPSNYTDDIVFIYT